VTDLRTQHVGRAAQTAGVVTRLAYARAKSSGVRLGPLLRRAGLTRLQIQNRDALLGARDQLEFLNRVADASGDDLFGFHLAQHCDLREGGLLYYVFASSESLIDVFQRGARYNAIVNEGVAKCCIDGKEIGIRLRYTGVSRHRDRHQAEFWSAAFVRMSRHLTGARLVPSRVRLAHLRTRGQAEMSRFFGCEIEFGASVDEITFAGTLRDLPVLNADPYLNRLLVAYCDKALSHRVGHRGSLRTRVENAIIPLLPHGKAQVEQVAYRLAMSPRTLSRNLASHGLTFSGLLREVRLELARRYLADENFSISQIAWLTGYQSVAAFSHAFKRWTGKTPRDAARPVRGARFRRAERTGATRSASTAGRSAVLHRTSKPSKAATSGQSARLRSGFPLR
jgi:AraC-like DNA-binding protein